MLKLNRQTIIPSIPPIAKLTLIKTPDTSLG
jgi:hypothetical protein